MSQSGSVLLVGVAHQRAGQIGDLAAEHGFEVFRASESGTARRMCRDRQPSHVVLDVSEADSERFDLVAWLCDQRSPSHLLLIAEADPIYAEMLRHQAAARSDLPISILTRPLTEESLSAALKQPSGPGTPARPGQASATISGKAEELSRLSARWSEVKPLEAIELGREISEIQREIVKMEARSPAEAAIQLTIAVAYLDSLEAQPGSEMARTLRQAQRLTRSALAAIASAEGVDLSGLGATNYLVRDTAPKGRLGP